jgi:arylsulfatase A-like enzyme
MAVWLGLAGGWLEVATRLLCRAIEPAGRLYLMSRHFVWLAPPSNLLLFSAVGVLLAAAARLSPRAWGWIGPRLLCVLAVLPALMVAGPRLHAAALSILSLGIAWWLVPWFERLGDRRWRGLAWSFAAMLAAVPVVAGLVVGGERLGRWREARRPLPAATSPNVLLIVLDTVRADRLSLYGHPRPTSPALERLARRGIRFDEARATAPWTLASHASLFTGRWPHELGARWMTPLQHGFPTLAGYLGSRGYATAGFVANTLYCSYDTGLDRGFAHYEDYVLDPGQMRPLRTAMLVDRLWTGAADFGLSLSRNLDVGPFRPRLESVMRRLLDTGRKDAGTINREFLGWLSGRDDPRRPFFAFLNEFDAHAPYIPPPSSGFRFGTGPQTDADFLLLNEFWNTVDKSRLAPRYRALFQDAYDNCLAALDERLGELFDELQRRGVLERTLIIVVGDHGEELGDHGLYDHGESLYRPEIRVPLLIVPPGSGQVPKVVGECVSLRDLPATIADLVGLADGSPFPGRSLARLWRERPAGETAGAPDGDDVFSELAAPNPSLPSSGRSPAARGPLVSLARGDYVYIRNEGDGAEELFHRRDDPLELHNRAGTPAMRPVLQRFRRDLERIRAGLPGAAR